MIYFKKGIEFSERQKMWSIAARRNKISSPAVLSLPWLALSLILSRHDLSILFPPASWSLSVLAHAQPSIWWPLKRNQRLTRYSLIFFNPSRESRRDKGAERGKGDRYRTKRQRTLWLRNVIAGNKVPLESIVHSVRKGQSCVSLRDAEQFRLNRYRDIKSDIFFFPAITSIRGRGWTRALVRIESGDRRITRPEVSISCNFYARVGQLASHRYVKNLAATWIPLASVKLEEAKVR